MVSALSLIAIFMGIAHTASAGIPSKVYGVNLGSWLLSEPWMFPNEWRAMGGETCDNCSDCIASESAYALAHPDTVDAVFQKHWQSWFSQKDVDKLVANGINTVRIPLGYWLVEALVDRPKENFPRGGLKELRRGLKMLRQANIAVILDHHALPGAQSANQMFAGVCTPTPQFYTPYNYHRALVWTAVMTAVTHSDPVFSSVFAIQAVNEPTMDANQTPGYGDFQKNFVQVVRAVELVLGIRVPGMQAPSNAPNATYALSQLASSDLFNAEVRSVLKEAVPILAHLVWDLGLPALFDIKLGINREPLYTNFMDVSWQYNGGANPADAAIGPQVYDNHLYFAYGGVADANPDAYLKTICNLKRVESDAALGNSPLWCGEWSLATNFDATDDFLSKWADSQKQMYSKGLGWIYWNFKTEENFDSGYPMARQWSYFEGLDRGYFTKDPSQYNNASVCAPYVGTA